MNYGRVPGNQTLSIKTFLKMLALLVIASPRELSIGTKGSFESHQIQSL